MMEPLIIVTGHPRSGTSMMMRMLHNGGITVIADENQVDVPHEGNKYGSFEVKNYAWVVDNPRTVAGCAVKIVTQYIHVLEALILETSLPIRVIFMERSISAIEKSLKERNHVWDPPPRESIALARKVLTHHGIPTLFVKYADALKYPAATCLEVMEFVGKDLDLEKMVEAIDPAENHQGA